MIYIVVVLVSASVLKNVDFYLFWGEDVGEAGLGYMQFLVLVSLKLL